MVGGDGRQLAVVEVVEIGDMALALVPVEDTSTSINIGTNGRPIHPALEKIHLLTKYICINKYYYLF